MKKKNPLTVTVEIIRVPNWDARPLLRMIDEIEKIEKAEAEKSQKPAS